MIEDEVVRALAENVGRKVLVTPYSGPNRESGSPVLLFVISVDGASGEGFLYNILTDPGIYDPKVVHQWMYYDVADVQPAAEAVSG